MLTSLSLSGRLGPIKEGRFRSVEVDRVVYTPLGGRYKVDSFLVRFPSDSGSNIKAPNGALIFLKGRIEVDEKYGVIIVDEFDEIFTANPALKKTVSPKKNPKDILPLASSEAEC
jgi:hypothetical protein